MKIKKHIFYVSLAGLADEKKRKQEAYFIMVR